MEDELGQSNRSSNNVEKDPFLPEQKKPQVTASDKNLIEYLETSWQRSKDNELKNVLVPASQGIYIED
jgi:hypothetical protein